MVEGSKRIINENKVLATIVALVTVGVLATLLFHHSGDSSDADKAPPEPPIVEGGDAPLPGGVTHYRERTEAIRVKPRATPRRPVAPAINYHAPQVLARPRENQATGGDFLALEGRFIGQIATPINTQEGGRVEVVLPYGGEQLPSRTTLFGKAQYPGEGDKVFIRLHRGQSPDGRIFSLNARVLSAADYSIGHCGPSALWRFGKDGGGFGPLHGFGSGGRVDSKASAWTW